MITEAERAKLETQLKVEKTRLYRQRSYMTYLQSRYNATDARVNKTEAKIADLTMQLNKGNTDGA